MNPREEEFPSKKEAIDPNNNKSKFPKVTSSRQWSNYKNPRIVRVSRAFGGKDRHSKVCTVRGLRDRRIRLSVPTAIQLYDLQERLGLNQPSKVVDWLLDATKHEIDKLPPLPMLPQFHQESSNANPQSHLGLYNPTKEGIEENHQEGFGGFVAQNLFPLSNNIQSSFPNFHYWDNNHPNMSLSQFGGGFSFPSNYLTGDDHHQSHNNLSPALPSTSSQLNLFPSATNIIPPIIPCSFPSYLMQDNDLRQINHLQHVQQNSVMPTTLHLISSPMKSLNLKTVYSQENDTGKSDKEKRSS